MCSNNAAFVLTLAAVSPPFPPSTSRCIHIEIYADSDSPPSEKEMFIQHLSEASHTQAKLDRKPRRNIQYKDVASAVAHQDNLEFLEDMVPKTVPYKKARAAAAVTQARLRGEPKAEERPGTANSAVEHIVNGTTGGDAGGFSLVSRAAKGTSLGGAARVTSGGADREAEDPNEQLEMEMRQAAGPSHYGDVEMTG